MDSELGKLEEILKILDSGKLSLADIAPVLEALIEFAKNTEQMTSEELQKHSDKVNEFIKSYTGKIDKRLSEIKDGAQGPKGDTGAQGESIIGPQGPSGDKGDTGANGKDGSPDTGVQIVDKINALPIEPEFQIDVLHIRGLENLIPKNKEGGMSYYGNSLGVGMFVGGTDYGTARYLNFIAGTNITLSFNRVGERNDLTINSTASGGGSLSVLAATGTVDDSNVIFTFASAPTLVVVNGNAYRDGHGVTIVGTTATLDSAVGTGGDIYGLGT